MNRAVAHRGDAVAGTVSLARSLLRRTRWYWSAWLVCLGAVFPAAAGAYRQAVPEGPAGAEMAQTLASQTTMRALLGPPFDLLHVGPFTIWRVGTFVVTLAGVMVILSVVGATRAEEQNGRLELLRSGPVGRSAPLAAAIVVALGGCAALAAVVTAVLLATSGSPSGSLVGGLGIGLGASVWVGVAAVTAQLCETARAARGISLGALGVTYGVRALADGSTSPTDAVSGLTNTWQWLSPLEWTALTRPFAGNHWSVLALPALVTAIALVIGFTLSARRDFGAGVLPARLGPGYGRATLNGPVALAWRLDRGTIFGWLIALAVFALGIGSLAGSVDQMLQQSDGLADQIRQRGGAAVDLREAFYVTMIGIFAPLIAILALQLLATLRREELAHRVELVLSEPIYRTRLLGAHAAYAIATSAIALTMVGALLALPEAVAGPAGVQLVGGLIEATIVQLPGVIMVLGLAVALHGWAPRYRIVSWLLVGWSLAVSWFGQAAGLPDAILRLTPWAHLPQLPADTMTWPPIIVTSAIGLALLAIGFIGYRRRDLT